VTIHLSILLFWPLALAILASFAPRRLAPAVGLAGSLAPLGYSITMLTDFDAGKGLQYVTDDKWIGELGVRYTLGVDGLSLWLILLTSLLFAASFLWITLRPVERPKLFTFHLALAETAVLGAFMAQDLALFVLFFDLMLVPFAFLVLGWGGPERRAATIKFFIYTLVGSLLMLAAAVATAVLAENQTGELTFSLAKLAEVDLPESTQRWLVIAFCLAFLIKMPLFPFQGWMPDAYRQMPLPALAVFSAVLSKVAAYGFLRIVLPLFPQGAVDLQLVVLLVALVSIVYGSAMAFTQTDVRLILGYSSMAQLGFITLGVFALDENGVGAQGALLQMVNHGLVVAPLFFIVLLLSERAGGSEDIKDMGGIAFRGPVLATLFLIVSLATLAIPGSANFAGEFLILLGLFKTKLAIAAIAFTGVAMASVYMLRAFIRSVHNRTAPDVTSRDLRVRDGFVLVPLVLAILAFGLYPQLALTQSETAAARSVERPRAIISPPVEEAAVPQPLFPGEVDPATGLPIDPSTGQPVDPNAPPAPAEPPAEPPPGEEEAP
jgi:NADH-quinone oxidoreductase subunit M